MTFVPAPVWNVTFSFRDNNGNYADTGVYIPSSVAFGDVSTFASGLAGELENLSDARLKRIYISLELTNDDTSNPPSSSEVERKLRLTFDAGSYPNAFTMEVPSPIFDLEQPRTDAADPSNLLLTGFVDSLLNGSLGAGNGPRTYFGADLTALAKAVIRHRNRSARD